MKALLLAFLLPFLALAEEQSSAIAPLQRQLDLLEAISPYVERIDLARIFVLKGNIRLVIEELAASERANRQNSFKAMNLIHQLIVSYRGNQVLLGWTDPVSITSVYTEETADELAELKGLYGQLVADFGFDDSPYTQVTAIYFKQIKRSLDQIKALTTDPTLRAEIDAFSRPIADAIVLGSDHDGQDTFDAAEIVVRAIRALYPKLDVLEQTPAGYPLVMELRGLTETYDAYARLKD